jgi:ABC-type metal ion transport system substrate-binding protein
MKKTEASGGLVFAGIIVIVFSIIGWAFDNSVFFVIGNVIFVLVIVFHTHEIKAKKEVDSDSVVVKLGSVSELVPFITKNKEELNEKEVEYFLFKHGEYLVNPTMAKQDDLIKYGNFVIRNLEVK